MTTLADSFLDDLDELNESDSDNEIDNNNNDNNNGNESDDNSSENDENDQDDNNNMNIDDLLIKIVETKASNMIGQLRQSNKYNKIINDVKQAINNTVSSNINLSENDPEYKLILSCNKLIQEIDEDIIGTHKYIIDIYKKKFPELETLISNRIDYIKTVQRIGNEMDITLVDLNDILPSALVMIVSVTGSTTSGKTLSDNDLTNCLNACNEVISLDNDKSFFLQYIESRMALIAPNLCVLIGSRIASQLIGLAGGLIALTKIPSCNVQVLGQDKRHLAGYSNISALPHIGILYYCNIVQECEPYIRKKILKIVAAKVALLARVDSYKNHPNGSEGQLFLDQINERIHKLTTQTKSRIKKALPIPEQKKKSKRGGKRARKTKERYLLTDLRKQQNRLSFTIDNGEYGDSAMGNDAGMIGYNEGNVRKTQVKKVKQGVSKKQRRQLEQMKSNKNLSSGLASSLSFTPVQGLELINPNINKVNEANQKWFNNNSGFLSAVPKKAN